MVLYFVAGVLEKPFIIAFFLRLLVAAPLRSPAFGGLLRDLIGGTKRREIDRAVMRLDIRY